MDNVEFSQTINNYINEYIKFADKKAGILLSAIVGLGTASLAILQTTLTTIKAVSNKADLIPNCVSNIFTVFSILACMGSVLYLAAAARRNVFALSPSLDKANKSLEISNVTLCSFPDIASLDQAEYQSKLIDIEETEIIKNYARHNHVLSIIAGRKFNQIEKSVRCLKNTLPCMIGQLAVYAISNGLQILA